MASAPPLSIAAPANPKTGRKKIPKYSTIRPNNARVSGSEIGHDGRYDDHKGLSCMTFASDRSSGEPELRIWVGWSRK